VGEACRLRLRGILLQETRRLPCKAEPIEHLLLRRLRATARRDRHGDSRSPNPRRRQLRYRDRRKRVGREGNRVIDETAEAQIHAVTQSTGRASTSRIRGDYRIVSRIHIRRSGRLDRRVDGEELTALGVVVAVDEVDEVTPRRSVTPELSLPFKPIGGKGRHCAGTDGSQPICERQTTARFCRPFLMGGTGLEPVSHVSTTIRLRRPIARHTAQLCEKCLFAGWHMRTPTDSECQSNWRNFGTRSQSQN